MKILFIGMVFCVILLYCMVKFTACTPVNAAIISPLPVHSISDTGTILYQLTASFVRVDTNALIIYDTLLNKVIQYRLSTGRILPTGTFVWIYNYKNNLPPFPLAN